MLARTIKALFFQVPSGRLAPGERPLGRVRLLGITMVRDEARFLPGMLRNVGPQVDGLLALDDGSSDGSGRLLEQSPFVLEVLRNPADRPAYDEVSGHRRLMEAALRHGAEWVLAVDADERLERDFRPRAERVIRRGQRIGLKAFEVHLRELWGSTEHYRVDGPWGQKAVPRLFRALPEHRFDNRPLHGTKAPLQGKILGHFPLADLMIYHLRMVRAEDREVRRQRYERLDPQSRFQRQIGYGYLTDESGIRLRPVPARRGFEE